MLLIGFLFDIYPQHTAMLVTRPVGTRHIRRWISGLPRGASQNRLRSTDIDWGEDALVSFPDRLVDMKSGENSHVYRTEQVHRKPGLHGIEQGQPGRL